MLLTTTMSQAQEFDEDKTASLTTFLGFEGLRPNNPNQIFDLQYFKDSTYFFSKDGLYEEFVLQKKIEYTHDNQGFINEETEMLLVDNTWQLYRRNNFRYNSSGILEYRITKAWDVGSESFSNYERNFYTSNGYGLIETEIIEMFFLDQWHAFRKFSYQYNTNFDIEEELELFWSEDSLEWVPSLKIIYSYNSDNTLSSELTQVWDESSQSWENDSFKDFEYNEDDQLVNLTESDWNSLTERWDQRAFQALTYTPLGQVANASTFDTRDAASAAQASVEATYDENGNLNTTLFKEWDPDAELWITSQKQVHFWSEQLIGNLSSSVEEITCFYSNPHFAGLPWLCNGLMENETYQLSVFDYTGALFHVQAFKGGHTFRISSSLPNGLYLVVIEGGLTRHAEKVLIRN
ncbi:MAG: hypothetical protein MK086_02670 [Flavobacteriales bacterium]|nr:hypothetical protein [Flavobacteriales bacterium]